MTVSDLIRLASSRLEGAGIEDAVLDAERLLGHCLAKSRAALYLMADKEVEKAVEKRFLACLKRREQREPLAYIVEEQEFWSLDFAVGPDVLIPRPETELLIEKALAVFRENHKVDGAVLDLCCGSGVIAVVLALELGRPVVAVDLSFEALRLARENARRHGVAHLVSFVQADLFSAIIPRPVFSLVLSNPPYVSKEAMERGLQPEVDWFEPHLALDGGEKGLEVIKKIQKEIPQRLVGGAHLFMEIGADQGSELLAIFAAREGGEMPYSLLEVEKDYAGHDRIFHARKGSQQARLRHCQS